MKTLYFDCFAGASGDMILGALVAAGVDPDRLRDQLSLLGVEGFSVSFETVTSQVLVQIMLASRLPMNTNTVTCRISERLSMTRNSPMA